MKQILPILFCVLAFVPCFAQEMKQEFYDDGSLRAEYKEVKGVPEGTVKLYYETGEPQAEINFSNGTQHGASIIYYQSGNIMKQMSFINGEQVDTMKIYYESSQLQEISIIKNKKKEGLYITYFENGELQLEGSTKDGQLHGICKHYLEDGTIEKEGEYYYGKPVGKWMEYDEIGVVQKQYGPPQKPEIPEEITIQEFDSDDFTLKYPSSWQIRPQENPAIQFIAMPLSAEGIFKENITVVVQPADEKFKKLDDFVDFVNSELEKRHTEFVVVSNVKGKNDNFKYRDVTYTMTQNLGYSSLSMKFWTRYLIVNKTTYQITFASELDSFNGLIAESTDIIDSFTLK